jgi:diacylglycerol kinase family enzyme
MRRIFVVLNERAGSLLNRDGGEVRTAVTSALKGPGREVEVVLARGRHICDAIDGALAADYDTLVVGGGDGSVSYAARKLAGSERTLGVLPLGTINLLGRDLGMPPELEAALAALADAETRRIDLGVLNDRPFHTLSGVGFFSQMARAREEVRNLPGRLLQVATAAARALARTGRFTLDIAIDGRMRRIDTYAVLVTSNCFGGPDWRRSALDAGMLEIHIATDEGALGRLKAGADLLTGTWRNNPGIRSYTAREVSIASGRGRAWVATDGELMREKTPLRYAVRPRALSVLAPR